MKLCRCSLAGSYALPDHPILLRELRLLERTPTRMGKDQVTHPRGCHDDHANVVCGVLRGISAYLGYDLELLTRACGDGDGPNTRPIKRPAIGLIATNLRSASSRSAAGNAGHDET